LAVEYDLKNTVTESPLAGLWKMASGYHLLYVGSTVAMGLAATFKSLTYLLLRYFVDGVIGAGQSGLNLFWIGAGFVGLALAEGSFTFMSHAAAARTAESVARRLRNYIYDHLQHLSFTSHDRSQTGELIQRSPSDVDAIRRFFADEAIMVGRIVLLFAVNLIALLTLNVQLALASIVVVPIVVVMSLFFFKRVSDAYERFQEQEAVLSTVLQENLSGVRVVKAFARQPYELGKFEKENWEQYRRGRKLLLMHALFWPTSDILCSFQMLAGFVLGTLMALNGTISIGTYLAYTGMVLWLIWPMRNLGRVIVQMSVGLVSLERVMAVIREEREPMRMGTYPVSGKVRGELVFNNVSFGYDDDSLALREVSFSVQPGPVIALMGSTGSGKTSLVNLIPRFYEYDSGSILLDGIGLNQYARHFLRRQIGIVEQEPFLFSRTIRENIALGVDRPVSQEEVEAAARAAAVHDVILSFPSGYDTLVGERGVTLSGGQKQRVAIARALLRDPRILILDDATSSVDTETEADIRAALERLMEGRTTFIIAHRVQSVMGADQIIVFDKGRIVQHGTHDSLMAEEGVYRRIYEMQARIEEELERELASV